MNCSLKGSDIPAAILMQLAEISDNISGVSGYDSTLMATQTAKILSLATNKSNSHFISINVLSLLLH